MIITANNFDAKFQNIEEYESWNSCISNDELRMHKIHVYPAKFPSFLIKKSLEYANENKITVKIIGDIFCGCGTTALEARRFNKQFWGCDINPVATLIAKVKSRSYKVSKLENYYKLISSNFERYDSKMPDLNTINPRILYWFERKQIKELSTLLKLIKKRVPKGPYQDYFLVAFSNILKKSSKWLTKSIKPQIDPNKIINRVDKSFREQFNMMLKAVIEINDKRFLNPISKITNKNFLKIKTNNHKLDMLITSPPYVTSYEYADLHQLSSLWLGYAKDYRNLRKGTIGSLGHGTLNQSYINDLKPLAKSIYEQLVTAKARRRRSVAKYFIDMNETAKRAFKIVRPGGLAVIVIGNTTYKNVYVDNAKYLTKCLLDSGFEELEVFKRKISSKILTPFRDVNGKFTKSQEHRKVYGEEFVLIGKKPV